MKVSASVTPDNQDTIFDDNENQGSSDNSGSQEDQDWQGAPLFKNSDLGVAAWPRKDRNGNWYLRIQVPLMHGFNLFVANGSHDDLDSTFNKVCEKYNGK